MTSDLSCIAEYDLLQSKKKVPTLNLNYRTHEARTQRTSPKKSEDIAFLLP